MSWTDFYVQSGGSNANGGHTTGAVIYTTASASWDGTSALVVVGAGAVSAGDWVNVSGSYVAQVASASATLITLSTTNVFGSAPGAGTVTINVGGPWADLTGVPTFNQAAPVQTRINIKQATYTLGGDLSVQLGGTSAGSSVWFRGYNTTPGDLDNGSSSLSYPNIACNGHQFKDVGSIGWKTLSGLSFTGSINDYLVWSSVGSGDHLTVFFHCRFNNGTSTGSCHGTNQNLTRFSSCYFTVQGGTGTIVSSGNQGVNYIGCYFDGSGQTGQIGLGDFGGNLRQTVRMCNFVNCGKWALDVSSAVNAPVAIEENTFFGSGSDHIRFEGLGNNVQGSSVVNNAFGNAGGWDVNNVGSTVKCNMFFYGNLSYNPTSGHMTGFSTVEEYNPLVDSTNQFQNSGASPPDLHLTASSNGAAAAIPGRWEGI